MSSISSREVLDALLAGQSPAGNFSPAELDRARSLAGNPSPEPSEVGSLPESLALAVLEATVRSRRPELALSLSQSGPKPLAKAAKKALYQLRSMGESLPATQKSDPVRPQVPAAQGVEEFPVLLSPLTGSGEQAMLLVRPIRGGGLTMYQLVLSDELGLVQVTTGELSRNVYRKQMKELRGSPMAFLELGAEHARQVLAQAAGANLRSRSPLPPGAEELLRRLELKPSEALTEIPAPEADDERVALKSDALHQQREIAPWLPPEPQLRLLAARLDEVESSPLQLSVAQKQEQLLQKVHATAREFFTPEMKKLYARRLWHTAQFFSNSGREEAAQLARAEARRLFHDAQGASRFAEFLFEKVLLLSQRAQAGEPLPEAAEALAPAASAGEKTSPGGLILP